MITVADLRIGVGNLAENLSLKLFQLLRGRMDDGGPMNYWYRRTMRQTVIEYDFRGIL